MKSAIEIGPVSAMRPMPVRMRKPPDAAVTTFWLGNVGVFLLVLWCAVVYAYCLPRRAHD
jgi:hypothetical protein